MSSVATGEDEWIIWTFVCGGQLLLGALQEAFNLRPIYLLGFELLHAAHTSETRLLCQTFSRKASFRFREKTKYLCLNWTRPFAGTSVPPGFEGVFFACDEPCCGQRKIGQQGCVEHLPWFFALTSGKYLIVRVRPGDYLTRGYRRKRPSYEALLPSRSGALSSSHGVPLSGG